MPGEGVKANHMFRHHREPVEGAPHVAGYRAQIHLHRGRKTQNRQFSRAANTARNVFSSTPLWMRIQRPTLTRSLHPSLALAHSPVQSLPTYRRALVSSPAAAVAVI